MDQPQGDDENLKDECIVDQSKLHALFGELFWSLTSGSSDTLRVTATELCDVYLIFWIYLLLYLFLKWKFYVIIMSNVIYCKKTRCARA